MRKLILFLTLPLFALDYVTKEYIVRNFAAPSSSDTPYQQVRTETVPVIDGFFNIVRVHNTGVAFGMANGSSGSNLLFGTLTIGALILIWWLCRTNAFPSKSSRVAVALLLAGIFGNLLDRFTRGYVVDFLDFHWKDKHWPSFNVADSAICIAAALLFLSAFQKAPAPKASEQKA